LRAFARSVSWLPDGEQASGDLSATATKFAAGRKPTPSAARISDSYWDFFGRGGKGETIGALLRLVLWL